MQLRHCSLINLSHRCRNNYVPVTYKKKQLSFYGLHRRNYVCFLWMMNPFYQFIKKSIIFYKKRLYLMAEPWFWKEWQKMWMLQISNYTNRYIRVEIESYYFLMTPININLCSKTYICACTQILKFSHFLSHLIQSGDLLLLVFVHCRVLYVLCCLLYFNFLKNTRPIW